MQTNGRSFFSAMPPVTKNLIIINVLIWLAMMVLPSKIDIVKYCGLHYFTASDFNIAQLFTYMFLHSEQGIAHLFFNMFTLFMFGVTLERVLGSKRFLFYYLSCGIGAALVQEGVWALMIDNITNKSLEMTVANFAHANRLTMEQAYQIIPTEQISAYKTMMANHLITIGASGAIYGVLLAFGMLFPNLPLYLMFIPIPIKAKWMVIGYGVIELGLGMSAANDGVAHFAHLGGMIFGVLMILYWKHKGIVNRNGYY